MDDHDTAADTVFRDITMLLAAAFLAVVILLLPFINPPVEDTKGTIPPGNIIITADWPDGWATDVDLWVRAPGELPVGYSNKDGPTFNLLRDDRGSTGDITDSNREQAVARGVPAGQYTVNLHLYANAQGVLPVPVSVEITVVRPDGTVDTIYRQRVELTRPGHELTVARFHLDKRGVMDPASLNAVQVPLRKRSR